MRLAARIVGFFFSIVFLLVFLKPAFAQTTTSGAQSYLAPSVNSDVPKNLHTYSQEIFLELTSALVCQISGIDAINPGQPCLGVDATTNKIGFVKEGGGAIGVLSYGIMGLYQTAPLHTSDYLTYLGHNFGLTKPSYAASAGGTGFDILTPLIEIWKVFRNISYLLFVIIFLIIGVAIMLRVKIDPRNVMTIQNQIPKLIIAIILITFSYAIAGFLLDFMYIVIYFLYGIFASVPGINVTSLSPAATQGQNVLNTAVTLGVFSYAHQVALSGKDTINNILGVPGTSAFNIFGDLGNLLGAMFSVPDYNHIQIFNILYNLAGAMTAFKIASEIPCAGASIPILGGISCDAQTLGEFAILFSPLEFFLRELLPYLIIFLIVMIAIFFTLFRVFFMLLKAYVFILIDVIFAPLWIAAGLIPGVGQEKGFGSWIRDLIANIAVFPAVYIMLVLASALSQAFNSTDVKFAAPLLGNPLAPGFLGAIVGLGILLLTPEAGKMIRSAIKAPNTPGGLGGLGVGAGVVAAPFNKVRGAMFGTNRQGQPNPGSAFIGRKFGRLGQALSGGGFEKGEAGTDDERGSLVAIPKRLQKPFQALGQRYSGSKRLSDAFGKYGKSNVEGKLAAVRRGQAAASQAAQGGATPTRAATPSAQVPGGTQAPGSTQSSDATAKKMETSINRIDDASRRLEALKREADRNNNS